LAAIIALGGIFVLLAAFKVLPSVPNAISYMGTRAVGLSLGLFALSCIVVATTKCKSTYSDHSDDSSTYVDPTLLNELDQINRDHNDLAEVIRLSPKRKADGQELDMAHVLENIGKASNMVHFTFPRLDSKLKLWKQDPEKYQNQVGQGIHKPIDQELKECVASIHELYMYGTYNIVSLDPSQNRHADLLNSKNEPAIQLHTKIDEAFKALAKLIVFHYSDQNSLSRDDIIDIVAKLDESASVLLSKNLRNLYFGSLAKLADEYGLLTA